MAAYVSASRTRSTQTAQNPTVAFGANVSAGSLLLFLGGNASGATATFSDTQGNTWNIATSLNSGYIAYLAWAIAGSSGANTVQVTGSASAAWHMVIEEFTPTVGYTWTGVDVVGSEAQVSGTAHPCESAEITSTRPNTVWMAGGRADNVSSALSADSTSEGWVSTFTTNRLAEHYWIRTATDSSDGDWTSSGSAAATNVIAAFYETASGGGGDTNARLLGGDLLHSQLFGRLVA